MKKLFYLVTLIALATTTAFAQVPQGFNYQAVIKDNNGEPLSEGAVDIEVKINKDFSTVYCESHENAAVEQGLLNLIIGTGALCGPETELSEVDWSTGEFAMEVTVTDMAGATVSGESPLVSVPFAMHAGTVENPVWKQDGNKVSVSQSNSLVGIGTANPSEALTLNGNMSIWGSENTHTLINAFEGDGEATVFDITPISSEVNKDAFVRLFRTTDVGDAQAGLLVHNADNTAGVNAFIAGNNAHTYLARNFGNVGIGTSFPSQKLHIENGNLLIRRTAPWIHLQESDNGNKNWYMVVDGKNFSVREDNTSTQSFTIAEGGNIGIGAPTPTKAKVQIEGASTFNAGVYHTLDFFSTTGYLDASDNGDKPLSLYASNGIAANAFHAFSDARIKNVKGVSDSEQDLKTLQQIEVTDYTYKDYIAKGRTPQKKVIAQQVAEVYPQAVTENNIEIIPDIMQSTEVTEGWVQLSDHGLSKGDKVRLIFEKRTADMEVTEITNEGFQVAAEEEGKVFVYGREVDDFHTVDYEAISMLNVSATQELAKVIERQQSEIKHLKSANADVMARLEALEAALDKNRSASTIQQ